MDIKETEELEYIEDMYEEELEETHLWVISEQYDGVKHSAGIFQTREEAKAFIAQDKWLSKSEAMAIPMVVR